jgi:hypothetical protein
MIYISRSASILHIFILYSFFSSPFFIRVTLEVGEDLECDIWVRGRIGREAYIYRYIFFLL